MHRERRTAGYERAGVCALGRVAVSLLVVLLLVILQSCSAGDQPFLKSTDKNVKISGKTPPPIALKKLTGIPDDKSKMFVEMLTEAAARRDIAVVASDFPDSFSLSGVFRAQVNSGGTVVSYQWNLDDGKGTPLHSFSGVEQAGVASGDPWAAVFPDVLRRIAAGTAENLASRLAQMGYATRTAGLPPPATYFLLATARDAQEIDYETVYGPGKGVPDNEVAALPASVPDTAPSSIGEPADQPQDGDTIRAIALTSVVGSPAAGDGELRSALEAVLEGAGWPVVATPRPDALTVTGRVSVDEPRDGKQNVVLAWNVRAPSGQDLGTVRQSNQVSAGSLAGGWADSAQIVAEAAAYGLFDLVKTLR